MRPILYASDFSPASRPAFGKAVAMAKRERAELLVTHVITPPPVPAAGAGYVAPATWDAIARGYRKDARRKLDALVTRAKAAGLRARGILLEGLPADQIVRTASSRHARLIVVGTRGRSGLARVFLGSVAGRVVARARCPVLTVGGR